MTSKVFVLLSIITVLQIGPPAYSCENFFPNPLGRLQDEVKENPHLAGYVSSANGLYHLVKTELEWERIEHNSLQASTPTIFIDGFSMVDRRKVAGSFYLKVRSNEDGQTVWVWEDLISKSDATVAINFVSTKEHPKYLSKVTMGKRIKLVLNARSHFGFRPLNLPKGLSVESNETHTLQFHNNSNSERKILRSQIYKYFDEGSGTPFFLKVHTVKNLRIGENEKSELDGINNPYEFYKKMNEVLQQGQSFFRSMISENMKFYIDHAGRRDWTESFKSQLTDLALEFGNQSIWFEVRKDSPEGTQVGTLRLVRSPYGRTKKLNVGEIVRPFDVLPDEAWGAITPFGQSVSLNGGVGWEHSLKPPQVPQEVVLKMNLPRPAQVYTIRNGIAYGAGEIIEPGSFAVDSAHRTPVLMLLLSQLLRYQFTPFFEEKYNLEKVQHTYGDRKSVLLYRGYNMNPVGTGNDREGKVWTTMVASGKDLQNLIEVGPGPKLLGFTPDQVTLFKTKLRQLVGYFRQFDRSDKTFGY